MQTRRLSSQRATTLSFKELGQLLSHPAVLKTRSVRRVLLVGWILGYLSWTLHRKEAGLADWQRLVWTTDRWVGLATVLLLMPLNWGLEAVKWRLLASPVARISPAEALKGVLSGHRVINLSVRAMHRCYLFNIRKPDTLTSMQCIDATASR